METLLAILLGIFQGLTEFLPVSSSGHLAVLEKIFGQTLGFTAKEAHLFNVLVHLATVLAVILVFRKTIIELFTSLFKKTEYQNFKTSNRLRLVVLIIIATIPTGIIGILGKKVFARITDSLLLIGFMFFITAILLIITHFIKKEEIYEYQKISFLKAFILGIVQGIAVAPGISRSGSTIACSRFLGISREKAGEFSFLIAIPAIIGAAILELPGSGLGNSGWHVFLLGFFAALITGYFSLKFLLVFIRKGKLHYFGYYVILAGIVSIVLHWRGL